MSDVQIRIHTAGTIKDIHKFRKVIDYGIRKGLEDVGLFGAGQIKQHYLRGPKPQYLRVDTGALIGGIRHAVSKNAVYLGTNVVSKNGFNYPEYWETSGKRHGGPRPFLKPLIDLQGHNLRAVFLKTLKNMILKGMK